MPREPFEFDVDDNSADAIESREVWDEHALAYPEYAEALAMVARYKGEE